MKNVWPATHYAMAPQKPKPGSTCPKCARRVPIPKEDSTPRKRSQLLISVPKDAEDGEAILRHLIELARELVGRPEGTPPYFTLVEALHDYITWSEIRQ